MAPFEALPGLVVVPLGLPLGLVVDEPPALGPPPVAPAVLVDPDPDGSLVDPPEFVGEVVEPGLLVGEPDELEPLP